MKIVAVNGGNRLNGNTGKLLDSAIRGAESKGAEVERFDLYKLDFKGCKACFGCKRTGSKSLFKCAVRDGLTPLLEAVEGADGMIVASPIYFMDITGEARSFLERLLFPYLPYDMRVQEGTYFPRELKCGFIYTMGQPQGVLEERLKGMEDFCSQMFRTKVKSFHANSCYPFLEEPSKYEVAPGSMDASYKRKMEEFDKQCEGAFRFGAELAEASAV